MSKISTATAVFGLTALANRTKPRVAGVATIGLPQVSYSLTAALASNGVAYATRFELGGYGEATFAPLTGIATGAAAGTAHVETATCVGNAGGGGNVEITLTNSQHTAANKTVVVSFASVLAGATPATYGTVIRAALTADADISAVYTVGGTGADIVLTDKTKNLDGGFNIAIANGTPTAGITNAATSTTTTAGVASVVITGAADDFEGDAIATIVTLHALLVIVTGTANIDYGANTEYAQDGTTALPYVRLVMGSELDSAIYTSLDIQSIKPGTTVDIIAFGTT